MKTVITAGSKWRFKRTGEVLTVLRVNGGVVTLERNNGLKITPSSYSFLDFYEDATETVNSPDHYNQGNIECIDAIRAALTPEEFRGFCKGNVMKYLWRSQHKGDKIQDEKKAQWYLNRLIKNE